VSEQTTYLGFVIEATATSFVVYRDGKRVGEAWSMPAARALIRKLRRLERAA